MSKKHSHPKLIVNMFGEQLGNLFFNDNGQLSFAYSNEHDSRILSVSMPDRSTIYAGAVVEKWFFGVLPDGESVRRAMAKGKEYGHNSVFGLLADYGPTCRERFRYSLLIRLNKSNPKAHIRACPQKRYPNA